MRSHFKAGVLGLCLLFPAGSVLPAAKAPSKGSIAQGMRSVGLMKQYAAAIKIKGLRQESSRLETLAWPDAVAEALQHNSSLVEARLLLKQGQEQVAIDDAGFLPVVTAAASGNRSGGQQYVDGIAIGASDRTDYQGSLNGTWNLFNGFATLAAHDSDAAVARSRQAAYDQASSAAYLALGQAFDQVIYDQADLVLLKTLVERYHSDTLYQSQEFKSGLTALWTYEKAQSDEAGEAWSYNQQVNALVSDRAALAILLGREADTADGLVAAGDLTVSAAPGDYHDDLQGMLGKNPTLAYYRHLAEAADGALWKAESTRYPSLDASGSVGLSGSQGVPGQNNQWQGALTLSYELFAGGGAEAAITQADEALKQAQETVADQKHQLEAAFIKGWINYSSGYQRLPSAAMAVHAGIDRYETVGALYQAGREEFLDYEQAESIYSGSQTQQLSALLGAAEAQVAYRNALGVTLEDSAADAAP